MITRQTRIGRQIKSLRALQGMTQEQLAEQSGIAQSGISRLESGRWWAINPDHMIAVADALNVSLDQLAARHTAKNLFV